ncbi:QRFP-like peptide receptor [Pocillopora verrucosa]|uniref:QRFP-like peptide receptor n=1 Tax=Pocillopora verrucosa TaxID=203993 RepID=UPI003340F887
MFDIYNASNQTVGLMTNFECPPHKVTTAEKAGKLTAYVIVFVMSFMGNNLIIYILFKSKNLKRNINLLVLNMAISDLFTSVFMIPRRVVQIALELPSAKWILSGVTGEITCKLQTFMQDFSVVVSTLTLVLISLERLVAVAFPLRAKMVTYRLRVNMIILSWVVSAAIHAPYFYIFKLFVFNSEVYCLASWEPAFEEPSTGQFYITFLCISVILIPFSLLAGIYTVIVSILIRQRNHLRDAVRGGIIRDKMNRNVLKMAVTIVVIFAICWAPLNINLLLVTFFRKSQNAWCTPPAFAFTAEFLVIANAAINPFVYFGFVENYRRNLKRVLTKSILRTNVRKTGKRLSVRRETFELTSITCDRVPSSENVVSGIRIISSKRLDSTRRRSEVTMAENL